MKDEETRSNLVIAMSDVKSAYPLNNNLEESTYMMTTAINNIVNDF